MKLNVNHEEVSTSAEDYKKLIEDLERKGLKNILKYLEGLSEEDIESIDSNILNPEGLSWGAFGAIDSEKEEEVVELLKKFSEEKDKEEKNKTAKELADKLE